MESIDRSSECRQDQAGIEPTIDSRFAWCASGGIFSAQQQILLDPHLQSELENLIRKKSYSAEYAVSEVFTRYAAAFRKSPSSFLAERANDVRDVERLLLEHLTGQPMATLTQLPHEAIVVSHDLTPGETAAFDRSKVLGICTEAGGPGGHTAIVARGMEIPAVVGVGNFLHNIRSGDEVIIDGHLGRIIVSPIRRLAIATWNADCFANRLRHNWKRFVTYPHAPAMECELS